MRFLKYNMLIFLHCTLYVSLSAQDSILTNAFVFEDGIYFSFAAFQKNTPDVLLSDVNASYFANTEKHFARVEFFKVLKDDEWHSLNMDSIWGFTLSGKPYIKVPQDTTAYSGLTAFAQLQIRGRICYFDYGKTVTEQVDIKAYNPLINRPFRTGKVQVKNEVQIPKMLHFLTGEITDFTKEGLLKWMVDDEKMVSTVQDVPKIDFVKLRKCLMIYDDRNPVQL